ncbi:MAG: ABC transporter permease [Bdellovibrionota bacterium]
MIKSTVKVALHALSRNLVRALLTVLGIVIGIASVITMVELGQGSSAAIRRTIESMGANNLIIFPGTAASAGVSFGAGSTLTLTAEDADALAEQIPAVQGAAPIVRARGQIVYGNRNWVPNQITGTTPEFLAVRDWNDFTEGGMFSDRDVRNGSKVCVLGKTIVRELFQDESPIGHEIRVQNVTFKVIGVLASKGANMMGMDQDDIVVAPWTTIKYRVSGTSGNVAQQSSQTSQSTSTQTNTSALYPGGDRKLYPERSASQEAASPTIVRFANVDQILVSARSSGEVGSAVEEIESLLRSRHRLRGEEPNDFSVRDMAEMTKALSSTSTLMTRLLLCVALISLLVGGVGIMNIMLVSVTERTREIGLRMAVGARSRDILFQFVVEAMVLCLAGGVLGIVFGQGASLLVTAFLKWPTQTSIPAIASAVGVSAAVGMLFGFYPAWKAAKLDPIEALRYE